MFFFVPGDPVPQGSKKGFRRGDKVVLVEAAGAKHAHWRSHVTTVAAEHAPATPIDAPVRVRLTFAIRKPTSAPKKLVWAAKRPDLDKLTRCVLDGLTDAGMFTDDARVVAIEATKMYAPKPGVMVDIEVIE